MILADYRRFDTNPGICDTIDTSTLEFAGIDPEQRDAWTHGRSTSGVHYSNEAGGTQIREPFHQRFNPVNVSWDRYEWRDTMLHLDGSDIGVNIEYSDVDYATTGDDHWTATCEDDLDGDGSNDWVTDFSALPGGESSVVRVRLTWNRDVEDLDAKLAADWNVAITIFSFNLKIKDSAPVGDYLPNTAATYDEDSRHWNSIWQGTTTGINGLGNPTSSVYQNVEQDPNEQLFSFNVVNADRVRVLGASMSIDKTNDPVDRGPVSAGDPVAFTIEPNTNGGNGSPVTMTFTDTLPYALAYVSDDCATAYAAVGLTCNFSISGRTITWTVPGYTVGDPLPAITLNTVVKPGSRQGSHVNRVKITSDLATFTDDSHCATAIEPRGEVTDRSILSCERAVTRSHLASASVQIVASDGFSVDKELVGPTLLEPSTDFTYEIGYENFGASYVGRSQLIDLLPFNGDGNDATGSPTSPQRWNDNVAGNANISTETADPSGRARFVSITGGAGETFEYSTTASNLIDHRPCHPSNWAVGQVPGDGSSTLLDDLCSEGLVDPVTDVPTPGLAGTGTTVWLPVLPSDLDTITAVRVNTRALPAGSTRKTLNLVLNTGFSIEGDLFCNSAGANASAITLDVFSDDFCAEVVSGEIGDYVWFDSNRDGIQDGGETPLAGVTVELLDAGGAPILDDAGNRIVAVTDAAGLYLFEELPSGDYRVRIDTSTLPEGFIATWDADDAVALGAGGTGHDHISNVTLFGPNNPGAGLASFDYTDVDDNTEIDFGYDFPVDVELTKSVDGNNDGNFTSAEVMPAPGISGNPDPSPITYEIFVENVSTLKTATGVVVTDIIPPGVTVTASTPAIAGLPITGAPGVGTPLVWNVGTLAPVSDATLTLVAEVTNANLADFTAGFDSGFSSENVAQVTAMNEDDLDSIVNNAGGPNHSGDGAGSGFDPDGEDDEDNARVSTGSTVSGQVWDDLDNNDILDATDPGIGGVTVTLFDVGGAVIATTTTASDGTWLVGNLTPGDYYVEYSHGSPVLNQGGVTGGGDSNYLPSAQNVGGDTTVDSDGDLITGRTADFTLGFGQQLTDIDQGYHQLHSVGNRVWIDTNADGIKNVGETGRAGVDLELRNAAGIPVLDGLGNPITTTTDADGYYLFTDLRAGEYTVFIPTQTALTNMSITGSDPDPDLSPVDSDATGAIAAGGWVSQPFTLEAATEPVSEPGGDGPQNNTSSDDNSNLTVDFGFTAPDLALTLTTPDNDADGSSVGTPVYSVGDDVVFTITIENQATLELENIDFSVLLPAGFTLSANDTHGWTTAGSTLTNSYAGPLSGGGIIQIPVILTVGIVPSGTALIVEAEITEFDLDGVTLTADIDSMSNSDPTDDAGASNGSVNSEADDATDGDGTGAAGDGVAGTDEDDHDPEDILVLYGSIGDTVWEDINADGVIDAGEPRLQGVTVTLLDEFGDPVLDAAGTPLTAITDPSGNYLFNYLPLGRSYTVIIDESTLPAGLLQTYDLDDATAVGGMESTLHSSGPIELTIENPNNSDADFGYVEPAIIGDTVWEDLNADGVQDAGEPGLPGIVVHLLDGAGNPIFNEFGEARIAYTDVNGIYTFENLIPGTYQTAVEVTTLPTDYIATFDRDDGIDYPDGVSGPVTVAAGETNNTLDFGYVEPATLGDYIWIDTNADGVQDAGETAIADVTVNLLDDSGDPVLDSDGVAITAVTDASGIYEFTGLKPGTYQISVDTTTLPTTTLIATFDLDDGTAYPDHNSGDVTVEAGEINNTLDFGYVERVTLGDYVWVDADSDGVQDVGETGISGVTVNLLDSSGDPILDSAGVAITDVTDLTGNYEFTDLIPGTYQVSITTSTLPTTTMTATFDLDDGTTSPDHNSGDVTLTAGQTNNTLDFGYFEPATLGDYVWVDTNADGVQDAGETGISGVTVNLLDSSGDPVLDAAGVAITDVTDLTGNYEFTNLVPGTYQVSITTSTLPTTTMTATFDLDDGTTSPDHNSGDVTLTAGQTNNTLDFGYFEPATLGDYVWVDTNADGVQDAGETGISGVTVNLLDSSGDPVLDSAGVAITAVTDLTGNYKFIELIPGTYQVSVDTTTLPTTTLAATFDLDDGTTDPDHNSGDVTLAAGQTNNTLDFGYVEPATLGNYVWIDTNADGVQDAGETAISGVTVNLLDSSGDPILDSAGDPITAVTDLTGNYQFTGLMPGTYQVSVDTTTLPTTTLAATFDLDDGTAYPDHNSGDVTLAAGQTNNTLDFGYVEPATLGNYIWIDTNADGVQDAGETAISGVTVNLLDSSGDPVLDSAGVAITDVTDLAGNYQFTGLMPGTYQVSVDTSTLPTTTLAATFDLDDGTAYPDHNSGDVTLAAGETNNTLDFGYVERVTLGDYVWVDTNADGVQDVGETGISGVTVNLLDSSGDPVLDAAGVAITDVTDLTGNYEFTDLIPGTYQVSVDTSTLPTTTMAATFDLNDGTTSPDHNSGDVTLTAGQTNDALDFGYFEPATLGDTIWNDTDLDGVQDAGETGIADVTVNLLDSLGDPILDSAGDPITAVTDASGNYQFTDLIPGTYQVSVDTSTLPTTTMVATFDLDDGTVLPNNNSGDVTLTAGETNNTLDFGYVEPVALGNYVWNDTNADGVQDADETGISGVTVNLLDGSGDPVLDSAGDPITAVTDATGNYSFIGLPPGTYEVSIDISTVPAEYLQTFDQDNGIVNPDENSGTTTLAVGEIDDTLDFGFTEPASISSRIWEDSDGDGTDCITDVTKSFALAAGAASVCPPGQDEPGIPGVTVHLLDAAGNILATTITDSDGNFSFSGLMPGSYFTSIDISTIPAGFEHIFGKDGDGNYISELITVLGGTTGTDVSFGFLDPTAVPEPSTPKLAFTGLNLLMLLIAAGALTLTGGATVNTTRRRKSRL